MKALIAVLGTVVVFALGLAFFIQVSHSNTTSVASQTHLSATYQESSTPLAAGTAQADNSSKGYIIALALTPLPTFEMPQIPVYPGAQFLDDSKLEQPPWYLYYSGWLAPATRSEVFSFYDRALSGHGWGRLLFPPPDPSDQASHEEQGMTPEPTEEVIDKNTSPLTLFPHMYYWSDSTGSAPYKFKLTVGFGRGVAGEKGKVEVVFTWSRVPDENKIPIPPDAEEIEVQNSADGGGRSITYLTDAKPKDMQKYYDLGLRYAGWYTNVWEDPLSTYFSYSDAHIDGTDPGKSPKISGYIYFTTEPSGKTKVRVEIAGLKAFANALTTP